MKNETSNFCGVRVEKLKNVGDMVAMEMHDLRDENMNFGDNIDGSRTALNSTTKFNGFKNVKDTYYECLKRTSGTVRKDHIKCLEYLFYRSDCLDTPEEYDKFRNAVFEFCKKYFKDCPFMICEHLDEGVQHFHVVVIPNGLKDEKYKFVGSDFVGKKQNLINLQTEFANYCSSCGLRRGLNKHTKDKHNELYKYYEDRNNELIKINNEIIEKNEAIVQKNIELIRENEEKNNSLEQEINKYKYQQLNENLDKYRSCMSYLLDFYDTPETIETFTYLLDTFFSFGLLEKKKDKYNNQIH